MLVEYVIMEIAVVALASAIVMSFLKGFQTRKTVTVLTAFPFFLFAAGFLLRLSGKPAAVDAGFFMTEFSFLFVYTVFALCFALGQIKYWRIKGRIKNLSSN